MTYRSIRFSEYVRSWLPPRIPAFYAVPGRRRSDGWTPLKQAEFIGQLAETRSIAEAARRVGMARESAYRLRRRKWSESFNAAWDAALGHQSETRHTAGNARNRAEGYIRAKSHACLQRKVTVEELEWRVESGQWKVTLRHGCYAGVKRKPCNSDLLQWVAQTGRGAPLPDLHAGLSHGPRF